MRGRRRAGAQESCWGAGAGANLQVTPDIQPEDLVTAAPAGTPSDSSRIMNVRIDKDDPTTPEDESGAAFINADGNVEVHGTAQTSAGERVELDQLEQRIIQPEFRDTAGSRIDRRDIRADNAGGRVEGIANAQGNLTYPNASNNWRAVYTGLKATERGLALEGQTRALSWLATDDDGERFGITIFEVGEVGGPGMGGAPPSGNESLPVVE